MLHKYKTHLHSIAVSLAVIVLMLGSIKLLVGWSDYDADWAPAKKHIPASAFSHVMSVGTTSAGGIDSSFVATNGATTAVIKELGTTSVAGFAMNVAEDIVTVFPWPEDIDTRFNVAVRTLWNSAATTQGPTFKYLIVDLAPGDALPQNTGSSIHGTSVDSVSGTRDTTNGAYKLGVTKWDTLTQATTKAYAGKVVVFGVQLQARATGATGGREVTVTGVELAYVPRRTTGSRYRGSHMQVPGFTFLSQDKGAVLVKY